MTPPQPPVALTGHCSVVHNNTLYVYSPNAFQSIDLEEGAKWKEQPQGVGVTGAVCVKAVPNGDESQAALYVVGGTADASATNYTGLQRFLFSDSSWQTITPGAQVTQNRLNHAATYINGTSSILVYAGSRTPGDVGPSSETFLISTLPPYGVLSFSSVAPPLVAPMLMPWDENQALLLGGSADNTALWIFTAAHVWQNLGTTLTQGIANQATTQCTVVSGDDGSKVLETYNMGVSPNQVTRTVLLNAGGAFAPPGQTIAPPSSATRRRDLTVAAWPKYNSTYAPQVVRSDYSIAQDYSSGRAVITGGNPQDPLCIFDERANTWVNATELFSGSDINVQSINGPMSSSPSSVSSSQPTSTSAAAPSSTSYAPMASSAPNKSKMLTVLGATLGTILGIAAIFIIILLLLKWKRDKRKRQRGDDYIEKDRLSFADRGMEFMKETGGSVGYAYPKASLDGSRSSLAIMSGRLGGGHKRGLGPLGSDASTAGLVQKKSPLAYTDPVEMSRIENRPPMVTEKRVARTEQSPPAAVTDPSPITNTTNTGRSRSSGWSRYFANNEATNLAQMPSDRSTYASDRTSANSASVYTDSRVISHPSQIPPLDLGFTKFEGQRISRVATGSPTLGHSREDLHGQAMQAELARANSVSGRSSVSSFDHQYTNGVHEGTTNWDPMSNNSDWHHRVPSSAYTNSVRGSELPHRDTETSFYDAESLYPGRPAAQEGRDSTVTVFPRGVPAPDEQRSGSRNERTHQDMSWLNLGGAGGVI